MQVQDFTETRFVSTGQLIAIFGITRPTLTAWVERHDFPRPLTVNSKVRRWDVAKIEAWIDERKESNDA